MMDDKALEEKAHAFAVRWGFQVGGQFEASLLPVLREVAEDARREAEAEVERLKVEYAAAIERGMRATAELQAKLAGAADLDYEAILATLPEVPK